MLDELLHEHQVLRARAAELLQLSEGDRPPRRVALNAARVNMMTAVSEHVLFEASVARELAEKYPVMVEIRRHLDRAGEVWLEDYVAHGRRWTADQVERDWPGFRRAKRSLLERLKTHLDAEERDFYAPLKVLLDGKSEAS